ncbi:CRISPR-associated endoribonuclease Cas6 [Clostridium paridis]|uniref:CRISPR-associated endoribonuclease Cas6 n=1 Tax=Clostridium paridis TaxID=2803863 RepID=A0A937FEU5_9CLOT|nr:CRISPR-associated endoribonuclease Cas6 [Clostridium paridis]MBL4931898.1 CRISPR-associated endoribonuclease Cas6 [Clostridium paridis]
MRVQITIYTECIPLAYRMMFVSLIKNSLEKSNSSYFNELYNFEDKKSKKIKPFTFSTYLEDYEMGKEEIKIKGKVNLTISTPDTELFINIYNGLVNISQYTYNNKFKLTIGKIILLKESWINSEKVTFKSLSPIVVKDKDGNFLRVEDERYVNELNYISNLSLKTYRGYGLKRPLEFIPVKYEKVVVKEKISSFTEITKKDVFYITGYKGTFRLSGDKEDLRLLYSLGIGYRRSQGFGNLEVIG